MLSGISKWTNTGAKPDSINIKDRLYQAPLIELPSELLPDPAIGECIGITGQFVYDQVLDPRCTGIALANTIDILRIRQYWNRIQGSWDKVDGSPSTKRVSAQMLYMMGKAFDELLDEEQQGSTLRGVLRGFWQNGVCPKDPNEDNDNNWVLTIDRCKKAREITLGSYARLQGSLLDYQTALKEIGVVLVSARIHNGWDEPQDGTIQYEPPNVTNYLAGHAFVLVGYTSSGFLILNSRGSDWGQWTNNGSTWKGVALWRYEDWYANIYDAWVIRLGVPYINESHAASGLFDLQSTLNMRHAQAQGVTRIMIQGHYLHTHDGQFMTNGVFVSDIGTVQETGLFLKNNKQELPIRKLVVFVESGLASMAQVAERAAILTSYIKKTRPSIYPLFVVWHEDVEELLVDMLESKSKRIAEITGGLPGATRSHLVRYAQDWLQPIWRTFEGEAERVMYGGKEGVSGNQQVRGSGWLAMQEIISSATSSTIPMTVHFIVHGAGLVWLSALSRRIRQIESTLHATLSTDTARRNTITSVDLLAPVGSLSSVERIASNLWGNLAQDQANYLDKRIRVFTLPDQKDRETMLGGFQGSFLELARVAFPIEGSIPTLSSPNILVGSRLGATKLSKDVAIPPWLSFIEIERIEGFEDVGDLPEHAGLMSDSRLIRHILDKCLTNSFID